MSILIGFSIFSLGILSFTTNHRITNVVYAAECDEKAKAKEGKFCPINLSQPTKGSGKRCGALLNDKGEKNPAQITPSIDLGCRGKGNGVLDLIFAIIRILSTGVGLIVIGSMIWAGIQYTSSRGDPQATANAVKRVNSTVIALLIYIFAYALLGWIIPGAILK